MKRRQGPPHPPNVARHSTVGPDRPPPERKPPRPRPRAPVPKPTLRAPKTAARPHARIAHIVDDEQESVLDLIDNLLSKGVILNAEVILALADVDLIYLRLSALLCAADRVIGRHVVWGSSRGEAPRK